LCRFYNADVAGGEVIYKSGLLNIIEELSPEFQAESLGQLRPLDEVDRLNANSSAHLNAVTSIPSRSQLARKISTSGRNLAKFLSYKVKGTRETAISSDSRRAGAARAAAGDAGIASVSSAF